MNLPKQIEHWDDETNLDHGIIVTLAWGWSFYEHEHQGVMSFETIAEAKDATKIKNLFRCSCEKCESKLSELATKNEKREPSCA